MELHCEGSLSNFALSSSAFFSVSMGSPMQELRSGGEHPAITPCMSRDPQSADQLLRSDGLHFAAPTGSCGVRLILITMLMVAVEMCTSLLVGIDVTFAMYSLLTVALLQTMKLDSCRAEVAVSGIIVTSFMIQDQFCQLYMACAFISIGFWHDGQSRC